MPLPLRTFRRSTFSAAFIGMASLMPFHGARLSAAVPSPEDTPITCIAENHDFTIADLRGRYVALHFLAPGDAAEQERHIRSFIDGSRSLAGLHHVYIRSDDIAAIKALAAKFTAHGAEFAHDAGGKLAKEYKLDPAAASSLVALDESGGELFRHVGSGPNDPLTFAAFRGKLLAAWAAPANADYNLPKTSKIAVQGYDVTAYFLDKKAAKGDEKISAEYRGLTYRFAGEPHREAFVAAPRKFLPTYGGWCASAMGDDGSKVAIDPANFKVKDGRLFLFYKSIFANALTDWNKNEKKWEPAADANWKKLTREEPAK